MRNLLQQRVPYHACRILLIRAGVGEAHAWNAHFPARQLQLPVVAGGRHDHGLVVQLLALGEEGFQQPCWDFHAPKPLSCLLGVHEVAPASVGSQAPLAGNTEILLIDGFRQRGAHSTVTPQIATREPET